MHNPLFASATRKRSIQIVPEPCRGAASRRKPATQQQIRPRVKVWLELDDQYVFGFGISEILKAIQETGSIKSAAELLGKSYRHVWARVKKAEQALGEPLVDAHASAERESIEPL